jgi:hypothetical protein
MEFKTVVKEISCCDCGCTKDNHRFRHVFKEHHVVKKYTDNKGDYFSLNAVDFDLKIKEGDCRVPQCSSKKPLHGVIIQHEFDPLVTTYREILFKLPLDSVCRYYNCKGTVGSHPPGHIFRTYVDIVGREDSDNVIIKCDQMELSEGNWSNNIH